MVAAGDIDEDMLATLNDTIVPDIYSPNSLARPAGNDSSPAASIAASIAAAGYVAGSHHSQWADPPTLSGFHQQSLDPSTDQYFQHGQAWRQQQAQLEHLQRVQQEQLAAYWHQQQLLAGQSGAQQPPVMMAQQHPQQQPLYYGVPYTPWPSGPLPPTASGAFQGHPTPQTPVRTSGELGVQAPDTAPSHGKSVKQSDV
jgi:hypothetical protein